MEQFQKANVDQLKAAQYNISAKKEKTISMDDLPVPIGPTYENIIDAHIEIDPYIENTLCERLKRMGLPTSFYFSYFDGSTSFSETKPPVYSEQPVIGRAERFRYYEGAENARFQFNLKLVTADYSQTLATAQAKWLQALTLPWSFYPSGTSQFEYVNQTNNATSIEQSDIWMSPPICHFIWGNLINTSVQVTNADIHYDVPWEVSPGDERLYSNCVSVSLELTEIDYVGNRMVGRELVSQMSNLKYKSDAPKNSIYYFNSNVTVPAYNTEGL